MSKQNIDTIFTKCIYITKMYPEFRKYVIIHSIKKYKLFKSVNNRKIL